MTVAISAISQQQVLKYLETAEPVFVEALPDQDFLAPTWDVRPLRRQPGTGRATIRFTRYGSNTEPLPHGPPGYFTEVVKAFLMVERNGLSNLATRFDAARFLWESLARRFGSSHGDFRWASVTGEDFRRAETIMGERLATTSTYRTAAKLAELASTLTARGIIQDPLYQVATRKPQPDQATERTRLPSAAAIEGLQRVYREPESQVDELLISIVALMMAGSGFRANELLTLPEQCETSDGFVDEDGKDWSWGLRFYKEKSQDGRMMLAVRGCTPAQQRLAQHALARIRAITVSARVRAAILEKHDPRVPLPPRTPSMLTAEQAARLLGCTIANIKKAATKGLLRRATWRETITKYRREDVEAYLEKIRIPSLVMLDTRGGPPALLSESLCVVPQNFFQSNRGTNPLLVEPVNIQHLNDFLSGRLTRDPKGDRIIDGERWRVEVASVFERYNIRETNGQLVRMTSHDLRHWATTMAKRGGLSDADLMGLQNRAHAGDLQSYVHLDTRERIEWLKRGVKEGRVRGAVSDLYFQIAEEERDLWLEDHIQAVHATALGICIHDFAVEPCEYALNCVRGCPDYALDTANPGQRAQLVQLTYRTEQALQHARAAYALGRPSESWVHNHEETLAGAKKALEFLEQGSGNRIVFPFADQPARFRQEAD
jgi:integrase